MLTGAAAVWTILIFAVPLAVTAGDTPPRWTAVVYAAAALVCHQRAERSFHPADTQMPVCARCTALYLGGTFGALAGWLGRAREPRRARALLVASAVPLALSVALGWAGLVAGSNLMRAASALPAGAAAGWVIVRMLRGEARGMRYDPVV